jgi:uncharacterized protein (DUF433 family)
LTRGIQRRSSPRKGNLQILSTIISREKLPRGKRSGKVSIDARVDPRELPAYGIAETAHYLRIPLVTLRSWVGGRQYPTEAGRTSFKPVITLPHADLGSLSFVNLVEAHVLHAVQGEHHFPLPKIPLPRVHSALDYVRKRFGSKHPLAEKRFETEGVNLFIARFQGLIPVSESRQAAIREHIQAHLDRIEYDSVGFAVCLYPFTRRGDLNQPKSVVIDPYISFGRPTIRGTGISTSIIAERYKAGDSLDALAKDYGCKEAQVEDAIRYELALAAA